jgi:DNA repair exonuclease SbcCD ATPase subunit
MRVRFIELELENFTEHRRLKVDFGRIARLSGRNGVGKTSIGTAPVWVLWGTDLNGKKWSPKPTTYEADVTRAALLLDVDGKPIKLERGIDGGDNVFKVNDVPVKAREFDNTVTGLFDRDEFLSLYNPRYFFTLHWTKQRELILRRVVPPAKSEVFKHLPEPQAAKLDELTRKHSMADLEKIHRDRKNRLEKELIAAESRRKTLQEQLTTMDSAPKVDPKTAQADIAKIDTEISKIQSSIAEADENNQRIARLNWDISSLLDKRNRMKEQYEQLKQRKPGSNCPTCGQTLQGYAQEKAERDYNATIEAFRAEYDQVVADRKAAESELAGLTFIDVSEKVAELRRWQEAKQAILDAAREKERRQQLEQDVEKARAAEASTKESLNESIFIIDAIKEYRAKEAELQAEKVQGLFRRLKIKLHNRLKNGELEDTFVIQMDGKDYVQLSFGEGMEAGLELSEVLFGQSELITPVFVDHIGEYTGPIAVYDQLITAGAVRDQELKIEKEEWAD